MTIEESTIETIEGSEVEGITVSCDRCDHSVEVFGTSDASEKRGCVMLREDCPRDEKNFYMVARRGD